MRCTRSLLCSAILLLTLAMCCGMPAFAQDPPNVAMGMSPSATYHGGDFDSVDMATGRLNLRIPLFVDHSQRGKLNFTYSVSFSSSGTWQAVISGSQGQFHNIEPPTYGIGSPALVTDGSLPGGLVQRFHDDFTGHWYTATWVTEDGYGIGLMHPMGTKVTGSGTESIDGSGIVSAPYSSIATNKEGIQFQSSNNIPPGATDANGNKMTAVWPTLTDTLGRTWTATYNSSNVTGCPTGGPVAPTSSTIWAIPGPANTVRTFKFCYSAYNVHTNFNYQGYTEYTGGGPGLTGVVLPDGTTWRFDYDNGSINYGDLVAVYPPTGGHISYTWTTLQGYDATCGGAGIQTVTSRIVYDGANSNTWRYKYTDGFPKQTNTFTVTDPTQPVGNDTAYISVPCGGIVTQIKSYTGSAGTGTLLKTVNKTYFSPPNPYLSDMGGGGPGPQLLSGVTTVWPNGQQSQVQTTYDSGFTFNDTNATFPPPDNPYTSSYGLVTSESHSDYGTTTSLSTTTTNYKALTTPAYATANILDLPISVVVTDGSTPAKVCAETDYGYDEYTPDPSGVTEQHGSAPNAVQGNLSSVTRQLFTNLCSSPTPSKTPLTTTKHVYDTGMIHTSTDPLNNPPTQYLYSGTYYGAFPTTVTNALNQSMTYTYDFNTGLMVSMTDPNSQTTSWSWDCMLRPIQAIYPDGGQGSVSFTYNPTSGGCGSSITSTFASATLTKKITSSLNMVTAQIFDGLGRPKQTKATVPTSTCSSGFSYLDTTYDSNGRTFSVSNPYCTTGDATYGLTKTYYDPLNRPCLVVPPDGTAPSSYSCPSTSPGNDVITAYLGSATTVTDQAGNQRRSISDGLGRLVEVDEPGPGSGTASDATGLVGIYGTEQQAYPSGTFDAGTVWITVNNVKETVSYGQTSTLSSVTTALVNAFNTDNNSPVTASANGIYITLTSKATGTSADYPISAGWSTQYPNYFSSPSFFASPASPTLNCGTSGSPTAYSVCTPVVTTYAYNAIDDLSQVLQAGSRQRTFVYDSLSRLTQATNPESSAISYTYDANSNVLTKIDARGITINYSPSNATIDPLNRVRGKTYSNGDPEVTYAYDGNAPVGCTPPALSDPYPIGRRTSMCDAAGNEAWSYDKMGRVAQDQRTTNGVTKTTTYATPSVPYNFDGSIAQLTYPSGRTITYTPNSAAQPISAVDTANSINYATMALYAPQGALRSLINGNGTGILSTIYYNNRLQPCRIAVNSSGTAPGSCGDGANTGNVLDYSYNFNLGVSDNGNVIAITNNLTKNTPTDRSQSFTYDVLNRIATAGTVSTSGANCWGEQYGYDAWGNLLSMTGITPQYNGCSQESGFSITVNANNQIAGFCYDAAGNLMAQSAPPCPSPTYTYNAENQLTSTAGVTYTYDGDGKRVEKSNGKLYWYGMNSDALDETDGSGNITNEYVFFGGKRIARRDSSGNVDYYFADHLGTARVVTNATGTVPPLDDSDFYPFGGQRALLSSSGNTYKFTGKEHDNESGLDNFGARYNSSQYGRFMTPDPAGKQSAVISNPQTWNKYSYVLNNPLRLVDPSGRFPTDAHIYWGEIALSHAGFTGDVARLSRASNRILDQGYFFTDRLHALAGDAAFQAAKSQLFSMALDSKRSDGERGLAVMAGMHLVEDYQAHKGLVGFWAHAKKYDKYPFDANPDSKEGRQALTDALHFIDGVKGALSNSLGDEAGQAKLNEMLNAAENLFNTDMVWGAMNDISQGINQNAPDNNGTAPNFSPNLQEEENRQCGLGNRAACN